MSIFYDIVDEIRSSLLANTELSDIKFVNADGEEKVPNPIENVFVSFEVSKVFIKEGSFGSYLGMSSVGEQYGNTAEIDIAMKIFSPRTFGKKNCCDVFSKIFEDLLYHKKNFNIKSISCEKTTYNNDIFSFELDCNINLSAYIGYQTEDVNISEIQVEKII